MSQQPPAAPRTSARQTWWDCLAIVLAAALPLALLRPLQDVPFGDDWTYAWSVQRLLAGHGLQWLDWSTHYNAVHVLWGALFCLPGGFSFTALRASTWTLAASGLVALYLLLRQLEVERRDALIGAATLGVNPIFFGLSFTFMTDVPFVALSTWTCLVTIVALTRRSESWIAVAAVTACLAIAVRTVGAVLPIAMALTLGFQGGRWGRHPRRLALAVAPVAFFVALLWWGSGHVVAVADLSYVKNAPGTRLRELSYAVSRLPVSVVETVCVAGNAVGLGLLPLLMATWRRDRTRSSLAAAAAIATLLGLGALFGAGYVVPLDPRSNWALRELGGTEAMVPDAEHVETGPWSWILVPVVLVFAGQWIATVLWRRRRPPTEVFLAWVLLGHIALTALLWLFHDRYALVLLVPALALMLAIAPLRRPSLAFVALAAFAFLAMVGVRDHLAYSRALWQAVDDLRAMGAVDTEINGGYVVNGWLQYAHPHNAPRGPDGAPRIPWINGRADDPLRYRIANRPAPGYETLATIPYRRWLGRSGRIYLLEGQTTAGPRQRRPPTS